MSDPEATTPDGKEGRIRSDNIRYVIDASTAKLILKVIEQLPKPDERR